MNKTLRDLQEGDMVYIRNKSGELLSSHIVAEIDKEESNYKDKYLKAYIRLISEPRHIQYYFLNIERDCTKLEFMNGEDKVLDFNE